MTTEETKTLIESKPEEDTGPPPFVFEEMFDKPRIVLLVGKCESGKSYCTQFLLTHFTAVLKKFKFGLYLSGSSYTGDLDWMDDRYLWQGYDEAKFSDYVDKLKDAVHATGREKFPPNFVVFDDLVGVLAKSQVFDNFMSTHRHSNTTVFICSQYLKASVSHPMIRELSNYVFLFKTMGQVARKQLFEWFGSSVCNNLEEFNSKCDAAFKEKHRAVLYTSNGNILSFKCPEFKPRKLHFNKKKSVNDAFKKEMEELSKE